MRFWGGPATVTGAIREPDTHRPACDQTIGRGPEEALLPSSRQPSTPRTLTGVGVGPGDPELLTLKAVAALRAADVVLVPVVDRGETGRAEEVVKAACPEVAGRIVQLRFEMSKLREVGKERHRAWQEATRVAVQQYEAGAKRVVFATVGDPSVYSTFSYLADHVRAALPDVEITIVPGITAMQALAAASLTPLVEGRETLTLVPVTAGSETLEKALTNSDTVVAYKGGRHLEALLATVRERRPEADGILGIEIGRHGQQIMDLADVDVAKAPYFSAVLVRPARTNQGDRP